MTQANQNRFTGQMIQGIIVTVLLIAIYRLGTLVPLPLVNEKALIDLLGMHQFAFSRVSIFVLGIMPYVSAYLLVEILSLFIPFLKKLRKGDYKSRRKLRRIAFIITLPLGILQGKGIINWLKDMKLTDGAQILNIESIHEYILLVTILVAGVFFLIFISELISRHGIGNGISILVLSGTSAGLFHNMKQNLALFSAFRVGPGVYLLALIIVVVIAFFIIRLLKTKTSESVGHKLLQKPVRLFQLNTCPSGTMAVPYATSIVMLPMTLCNFMSGGDSFACLSNPTSFFYIASQVIFIFAISYLFAWLFFHPARRLKRMRERGWTFLKSEQDTTRYLSRKLLIYNLPWTVLLCGLAVIPTILIGFFNVPFYIGGSNFFAAIVIACDIFDRYKAQRNSRAGKFVKIAELHDVYDASMIKNHLETKGILSHLQGYYHRHLLYFFGPYIDISLMVGETDIKAATELLRKYYKSLGLLKP